MARFIKEITTKDLDHDHKEYYEKILKIATLNQAKQNQTLNLGFLFGKQLIIKKIIESQRVP